MLFYHMQYLESRMNLFHEAKKVLDKDGKVNPLGPYGKQKLTGREVSTYFRRNKVSDPEVKKAVEVALDLGGADTIARQEIKKFYGDKILKSKEVQNALKYANEEFQFQEDYKKVIKMYPRDKDWKKLITKHRKAIDDFRKNNKDLPKKVEDDLIGWASSTGAVGHKDDVEDFIMDILDEGIISEKFKPYSDKQYPRCVDFYIQFRGGKGDRITSEENKKDFIKATDMIDAYCKKNKIKQKPVYSTPMEGSSAYKVGLMIDKTYSKTDDYDRGVDLQPLYVALSKLKTAEDHGGGWSQAVVKEDEVEEGKDKIKYRGNLKGLKEGKSLKNKKEEVSETTDKEIKAVQKLSKDMQSVLKGYQKITGMGDKELKDTKHNDTYKSILDARDKVVTLIGTLQTGKLLKGEETISEGKNLMPDVQKIVDTKGAAKVGGIMIDMFTASMITQIYSKVNDQNKKKMEKSNISTLVDLAQRMMQKMGDNMEGDTISEEMITYRVKGMQKPEEQKFIRSAKMMGLKITMDKGKKDTVIVMSGTKKKLRDFDAVARGKSSYGDPSTITHFDEK